MDNIFLRKILDGVRDGVYFVDKKRKITFWNKRAEEISGFKKEDIIGRFCYDNILNHVDLEGKYLCFDGCPLHATMNDGRDREQLVFLQHKAGNRVPVYLYSMAIFNEQGDIIGAVETFNDESHHDDLLENVNELTKLAYEDELTKLHNRRYIMNQLKASIIKYGLTEEKISIAIIDIDFFKKVNDTYGHDVGDEVLQMLAKVLKTTTRPTDRVGRYGGEEFLIVFDNVGEEQLASIVERYRFAVEFSKMREYGFGITISIGATTINKSDNIDTMFKRCDDALYKAKENGRNRVEIL